MPSVDYKSMLKEVRQSLEELSVELDNLEARRIELTEQLEGHKKVYNAIAPLVGEQTIPLETQSMLPVLSRDQLTTAGISVAVRYVLEMNKAKDWLTTTEVRDLMQTEGWPWEKYTNFLATVQAVLNRLATNKVIESGHNKQGKKCFRAISNIVIENAAQLMGRYVGPPAARSDPPAARYEPPAARSGPLYPPDMDPKDLKKGGT